MENDLITLDILNDINEAFTQATEDELFKEFYNQEAKKSAMQDILEAGGVV